MKSQYYIIISLGEHPQRYNPWDYPYHLCLNLKEHGFVSSVDWDIVIVKNPSFSCDQSKNTNDDDDSWDEIIDVYGLLYLLLILGVSISFGVYLISKEYLKRKF